MEPGKRMVGKMNKPNNKVPRDYLAICVFVTVLIGLAVCSYYLVRTSNKDSIANQVKLVSKWLQEKYSALEKKEAEDYLSRAHELYSKENYGKALREYDKAIQADQNNFKAYFWRGRTYIRVEQYDNAIIDFKRVIKLKADYVPAYDNLGWLYSQRGEYDESISYLTKSVELEPENGWAYFHRGRNFFFKGDQDKALRDAEQSCRLGYQRGCRIYQEYKESEP